MRKPLVYAGALLAAALAAPACFAQQPGCSSPLPPPGYGTGQACPQPPGGGYSGTMFGSADGCPAPCPESCKQPGCCKRCYYHCKDCCDQFKDWIHSCLSKHHQITSPQFMTHPSARSPRDYFMMD
jgi:hypothetical protein